MENKWKLPSNYIPVNTYLTNGLTISSGGKVVTTDNWNRKIYSGSLDVVEEGINGLIDTWVYFHSVLFGIRTMIYAFQSSGNAYENFNVTVSEGAQSHIENFIDYDDIGTAVYGEDSEAVLSYNTAFYKYLQKETLIKGALKNFFLAKDLSFNKKLKLIDTSYWQIAMYISTLESLLPPPEFCEGYCTVCSKKVHHIKTDTSKSLKDKLFSKIVDKDIRKQYRDVIDKAGRVIRNDTVHNGLYPIAKHISLSEGVTHYSTNDAVSNYKVDKYALETLVDQLHQLCRYFILNEFLEINVFPPLTGINMHSVTIKPRE